MSASPMTPLDYIAAGYWQDFLAKRAIAGGLACEMQLIDCVLDESLGSLQRIDTLLSQIRRELIKDDIWDEDQLLADERYRNLLVFLGFYAGRVLALAWQHSAHWYGPFELKKRYPELPLVTDDFYQHMAVVYRQDDSNQSKNLFFALEPIGLRLFGHIDRPFVALQGAQVAGGLYQAVKTRLPFNTLLPKNILDQNLSAQASITDPQIASEHTKSIEPNINVASHSNVIQHSELESVGAHNLSFQHLDKLSVIETDTQSLNSKLLKENSLLSQSTVVPADIREASTIQVSHTSQAPKVIVTPAMFTQLLKELDEIEVIQTAGIDDYNRARKVLDQFEGHIAKQAKPRHEVTFSKTHQSARKQALIALKLAADMGHTAAMLRLAMYELLSEGLVEDKEAGIASATALVEQAAHKNDSRAQRLLSKLYYQGVGVSQDVDKGKYWLEQATDNGHSEAANVVAQWQQAQMLISNQKQEQHSIKRYQLLIVIVVIVAVLLIIFV